MATGRNIRVLSVLNTFSRYVPVADPRFSYCGKGIVQAQGEVCTRIDCGDRLLGSNFGAHCTDVCSNGQIVTGYTYY